MQGVAFTMQSVAFTMQGVAFTMQGVAFTMQGECRYGVACQNFSKVSVLLHLQYNATVVDF